MKYINKLMDLNEKNMSEIALSIFTNLLMLGVVLKL